ncbi:MAG: ribonuclease P [Promethearchaeota archaeon]|nr:MAG: ribonuclease P [Candidatus Lokiarchaeota archaeon]
MTRGKKRIWKNIKDRASNQIDSYFDEIDKIYQKDMNLANRYLAICRNIGMRCKVRIPRNKKILICNNCKKLLIPGKTARVRVRHNKRTHVTITCLNCKNFKRYYVEKKQGSK